MTSGFHIRLFRLGHIRNKTQSQTYKKYYSTICDYTNLYLFTHSSFDVYFFYEWLALSIKWKFILTKSKLNFAIILLVVGEIKNKNEIKYYENLNNVQNYYKLLSFILIFQKSSGVCYRHVRPFIALVVVKGKLGVSKTETGGAPNGGTRTSVSTEKCTARLTLILMDVAIEEVFVSVRWCN